MDQVQSTGQMLLDEFRQFRRDLGEWQRETGERLARLETEVKSGISGNGQPSRLKMVEGRVDALEHFRWYLAGGLFVAAGVVEMILHAVAK
jgi:hypothetical protein